MDGVVIDSSPVLFQVWNGLFEKLFGLTVSKQEFAAQFGKNGLDFTKYFFDKYNLKMQPEEFYRRQFQNNERFRTDVHLKKGVLDQLKTLKPSYKIALATGAPRESALDTVNTFHIKQYFDFIIGGDEVNEAKPNPEIFLKAAEALNLEPKQCVVVEDAILGIQAAKAANMTCIAVEDDFTKYQDHSMADFKIESMGELNEILLNKLK